MWRFDPILNYYQEEAPKCFNELANFESNLLYPTIKPFERYTKNEREMLVWLYRRTAHTHFYGGYVDEAIVFFRRILPHLDIKDLRLLAYSFMLKKDFETALKCFRVLTQLEVFDPEDSRLALDCEYLYLGLSNDAYIDTKYFKQAMCEMEGWHNPDYFVADEEEMIVEFHKNKIAGMGSDIIVQIFLESQNDKHLLDDLVQAIENTKLSIDDTNIKTILMLPICYW